MKLKNKSFRKHILKIAGTLIDMENAIVKYFDRYKGDTEKAAEAMFVDPIFSGYIISKDIIGKMVDYIGKVLGRTSWDVYDNKMFELVYSTITGSPIKLPEELNLHNIYEKNEKILEPDKIIDNLYKVVNFEILKETYIKLLKNKDKYLSNIQKRKDQEIASRAQRTKWASMRYNVLKLYLNSFDRR